MVRLPDLKKGPENSCNSFIVGHDASYSMAVLGGTPSRLHRPPLFPQNVGLGSFSVWRHISCMTQHTLAVSFALFKMEQRVSKQRTVATGILELNGQCQNWCYPRTNTGNTRACSFLLRPHTMADSYLLTQRTHWSLKRRSLYFETYSTLICNLKSTQRILWDSRLREALSWALSQWLQNTSSHLLQTSAPQHPPATVLG